MSSDKPPEPTPAPPPAVPAAPPQANAPGYGYPYYPPAYYAPPPPPMKRADFSSIFGDSFQLYIENFVPFFLVYLVVGAVVATISAFLTLWMTEALLASLLSGSLADMMNAVFLTIGITVLVFLATFVIASVVAGGMTHFAVLKHRKQPAAAATSLTEGLRRVLSVMGASLLWVLLSLSVLLGGIFSLIFAFLTLNLGLIILGIVLIIAGIPVAIILWVSLSLVVPAVMMEGRSALDSVSRSWALTTGHRLSLFGVYLVFVLMSSAASTVATMLVPATNLVAGAVVSAVVTGIAGSWLVIAAAVGYDFILREPMWPAPMPPVSVPYAAWPPAAPAPPQAPPPAAPPPAQPPVNP